MYSDVRLEFFSSVVEDVIKYVDYFFVIIHSESEEKLGQGTLYCFSAKQYHPAYIREQCDALMLHAHQTMRAVRIFSDEIEAEGRFPCFLWSLGRHGAGGSTGTVPALPALS